MHASRAKNPRVREEQSATTPMLMAADAMFASQ